MVAICGLKKAIAPKATVAIANASAGNVGNRGTLKGLSIWGSFLRSAKNDSIETMYRTRAPKQAMVMISPVLPVNSATMPTSMFTISAVTGVRNFLCTFPKIPGAYPTLPNSKVARPPASMIPLKEAIRPKRPMPTNS